jgi:hypothetical protein
VNIPLSKKFHSKNSNQLSFRYIIPKKIGFVNLYL